MADPHDPDSSTNKKTNKNTTTNKKIGAHFSKRVYEEDCGV